jgi:hypothetical protein
VACVRSREQVVKLQSSSPSPFFHLAKKFHRGKKIILFSQRGLFSCGIELLKQRNPLLVARERFYRDVRQVTEGVVEERHWKTGNARGLPVS